MTCLKTKLRFEVSVVEFKKNTWEVRVRLVTGSRELKKDNLVLFGGLTILISDKAYKTKKGALNSARRFVDRHKGAEIVLREDKK